jgi:hypothetical protein
MNSTEVATIRNAIAAEVFNSFTIDRETAQTAIADHIYAAYQIWGDDDEMVASEILHRAGSRLGGISSPNNHAVITSMLTAAGGARAHQSIHQFTMGFFSNY